MSWSLLQRFIESDHFNNDPSLPVAYLSRYADHVGIQYVLCSRLRRFSYEQIEFFLPELCHILVSIDNESMALEEFVIDLCHESVSSALLTLWLFQTYLHDLAGDPHSASFRTCRRIFNKVQNIVFGTPELVHTERISENALPVTVLAGIILGGIAAPFLPAYAGPIAIGQARRPRPADDTISETAQVQPLTRSRSHTISGSSSTRRSKSSHVRSDTEGPRSVDLADALGERHFQPRVRHSPSRSHVRRSIPHDRLGIGNEAWSNRLSSASLPDIHRHITASPPISIRSTTSNLPRSGGYRDTKAPLPLDTGVSTVASLSHNQKVRMLRSNYFRNETQFLSALESISIRLVAIPKLARLSALRAELALIDQDLPAEVDIPLLCPPTLVNGSPSRSKHHRIVRLNPSEATSLNSAERVPYLLMVEVLLEDFDFEPDTPENEKLLQNLVSEQGTAKRRLFDTTTATALPVDMQAQPGVDSVFEPLSGDLSSSLLLEDFSDIPTFRVDRKLLEEMTSPASLSDHTTPGPDGLTLDRRRSTQARLIGHRTGLDGQLSRTGSPAPHTPNNGRVPSGEQPDFPALATHMRTAAQMLAQLEVSGSKRPRQEVEAIKAKIIASMQSLEEQNFVNEDSAGVLAVATSSSGMPALNPAETSPTFDSILASMQSGSNGDARIATAASEIEAELEALSGERGAGAARMENDQKTGGVRRKGDRDDPSAATFGEEWSSKKERIRRSSPYGWMKNWDLLSVIVKTGSDLRQEAFACQLIQLCAKIWEDAGVEVWVKRMRILVTGESCGLIETIANGVSLHSLKRSLTLSTIAAGQNPRKRFATLKDHFVQAFGEPESATYRAAVEAFTRSLAAYSMLSYVLQLKDRHNGNILLDTTGHIMHIDFGFMLTNSPGSVGFEAAPFKLTQEYVDVLGGVGSTAYERYRTLCKQAFLALRKSADTVSSVVDLMGKESKMACFVAGRQQTTAQLRARFVLHLSTPEAESFVDDLIAKSLGSYYTRLYDTFQYRTQGIY